MTSLERTTPPTGSPASWITEGGLVRAALRLSLPLMLQALLQNVFVIVDMRFVGQLGSAAVAALGACGAVLGILFMLSMGLTTGCATLVAQAVGAGNRARAESLVGQVLLMAAVVYAVFLAAVFPLADEILRALGMKPDVVAAGAPYLRISVAGSFAMLLTVSLSAALRGAGDIVTPLVVLAIANVVNIALDPILIFGLLGAPAMGVAGSAVASVAARMLAAAMLARVFFRGRHAQFHLRWRHLLPRSAVISRMSKIGVFSSGRMLMINISSLLLVRVVAMFGTAAAAAYTVGLRLMMTVIILGMGFGNAAAILVGQNLGARRPHRAVRAGWLTAAMYALMAVPVALVFHFFAENLIAFFNDDPQVVAAGSSLLRWLALTLVFLCMSIVLGRAMSGAGDTFWPMVITAAAMLGLRIPLAYWLSRALSSETGVWIAIAISNLIHGGIFIAAFAWGRWKKIGEFHVLAAWRGPAPAGEAD